MTSFTGENCAYKPMLHLKK